MFKTLIATLLAFATTIAFAATDINQATQAELEAVKGIGPAVAGKMLDERKKAPFKDWQDLMARVGGIKNAKAGKLSQAGLTVNGKGYVIDPAHQADKPAPKAAKPAA